MRPDLGGTQPLVDDAHARRDDEGRAARRRFEQNAPQAMTDEDSSRLDMIIAGIGDLPFPANSADLVARARRSGDDELVTELRSLPDDARYGTLDELLLAMGIGTAGRIDVPGAPPRRPDTGPPSYR